MRKVAGRLLWGLVGLGAVAGLAVGGTHLIVSAGVTHPPSDLHPTRTFSVPGRITNVTVQSYGDPVSVTSGNVRQVRVTEMLDYDPQDGGQPPLLQTVDHGQLTLGDPQCFNGPYNCDVSYAVTVPRGVSATVDSYGGNVAVSGTAGATVDSNGGNVTATRIAGPLAVSTGGGELLVNGLTGPLTADTYGGTVTGRGVAAPTATAITSGGDVSIVFSTAPDDVMVSTDGGAATLTVPGGPYDVAASDDQGGTLIGIPVDPAARRLITVNTGGGPIQIRP